MLHITLDLDTGLAKLAAATTIKVGAPVPVKITTVRGAAPASPGPSPAFELGLGTDATPPVLTAYLDEFAAENAHTYTGVLDANDTRLVAFMAGKGQVTLGCEIAWTVAGDLQVAPTFPIPVQPRIISGPATSEGGPSYYTEAEVDALLPARTVDVPDAPARLALTTASVRTGDFVREVGRAEVTKLTCLGSTYVAPIAETTEITCNPDVVGSLNNTWFYLSTLTEGVYVWFNVATLGVDPAEAERGIEIAIPINETAVNIAIAITAALDADADFSATRVGAVVTVVNDDAGVTYNGSSFDNDTGFTVTNPQLGTDPTHTLQGTTLTLYSGTDTARTVGFSFAGNAGDIAVTLPASTQTAAQIAALARTAIEAHADFSATVSTTEVTVTNAAKGWVRDTIAGTTGFTVAVLTQALGPYGTWVLVDETVISTDAAWRLLSSRLLVAACPSNAVSMVSDVLTPVTFSAQAEDFGCFNLGTGVFTAPRTMTVIVHGAVHFDFSGTSTVKCFMNLLKNGSAIVRLAEGAARKVTGSVTLKVAAGDTLSLSAHQLSGGTVALNTSALGSLFQITEL